MSAGFEHHEGFIELHWGSRGEVQVVPGNQSLLLSSVNEAIEACGAYQHQLEFKGQFDALLSRLAQWVQAQESHIREAFLTTREAGLLLLLVLKSTAYNPELESEITELDIEVANAPEFALMKLSVLAIPPCSAESVQSFLSRKMALRFPTDGNGN